MLFITESEVRQLLPMGRAIELMEAVFRRLAKGDASNQPRRRLVLPTGSVLHYMAGSDGKYFGAKVYSTHPAHGAHFIFLLYRATDGEPLALIEANALGQIRTGAVTGLASRLMAKPGSQTVGLIGSGFQARTQLEAVTAALPIRRVKVWSRSPERRRHFAEDFSRRSEYLIEAAATAEEAVRGADILITATSSRDPVVEDSWISRGTHINAMGSNQAKRRELPAETVRRADWVVVDSLEQARAESGDLLLAWNEEDWKAPRVVELHDVVSGKAPVRRDSDTLTLFKSNGLAVEDVIVAGFVYERAVEQGLGRRLSPHS
jgi:ornithine cyclodeaminase/alanine dehydrogenase-like protein (mu-crystallin family)